MLSIKMIIGVMELIAMYENMELTGQPKELCNLLIRTLKKKFEYELNSPIYLVRILI